MHNEPTRFDTNEGRWSSIDGRDVESKSSCRRSSNDRCAGNNARIDQLEIWETGKSASLYTRPTTSPTDDSRTVYIGKRTRNYAVRLIFRALLFNPSIGVVSTFYDHRGETENDLSIAFAIDDEHLFANGSQGYG